MREKHQVTVHVNKDNKRQIPLKDLPTIACFRDGFGKLMMKIEADERSCIVRCICLDDSIVTSCYIGKILTFADSQLVEPIDARVHTYE